MVISGSKKLAKITNGQVAIFYATGSLALLWKLVSGPGEEITYTVPQNQSVIVVNLGQPYDDVTCYSLIATATGKIAPDHNTDRCVVVDNTNTVVDVQKRDPVILPVQPNETAIIAHQFANFGDIWTGSTNFTRRVAIYDISTGIVSAIQTVNITSSGAGAVAATATQGWFTSNTLQVGQNISVSTV